MAINPKPGARPGGAKVSSFVKTGFYLYYLRRPDKVDSFDPTKGQPFYTGKGCNGRASGHRIEANSLRHKPGRKSIRVQIIHKLWKQGLDFQKEIVFDNLTEQDAFALEIAVIEQYGRIDLGTGCLANMTNGGEGACGAVRSEETKERIRQANIGPNNHNFGKIPSEETKEKNRQSQLGRIHSPETREKIRQASLGNSSFTFTGRMHSLETKEKIRQSNLGKHFSCRGRAFSEDHKEKIRQALLGKLHSEERKEKNRQAQIGKKCSTETIERMRQAQRLRYQREMEAQNGG